ncbi:hypothetical protein KM043_003796 [Ampulex compressa]|nr:hypothetical protein KM043_003796 [Ampulex compressa]
MRCEAGYIYDLERERERGRAVSGIWRRWAKAGRDLSTSPISPRLRDSLRLDGGVNMANIAGRSPAYHFASPKAGIRGSGRTGLEAPPVGGRREEVE